MMKKIFIIVFVAVTTHLVGLAQNNAKFSPERFQEDMERYIIKEACLTQDEAHRFMSVYREMRSRQMAVFGQSRKTGRKKPAGEKECLYAIKQQDKLELELKKIQQTYHNKFLEILPAGKVFDVIRAEERFHRHSLKQWSGGKPRNKQ